MSKQGMQLLPIFGSGVMAMPGESEGTSSRETPRVPSRSGPVRAGTISQRAAFASLIQLLRPWMRQPPATRSARVWIAAASLPACGSVSARAQNASPAISRGSISARCRSLPQASSEASPKPTTRLKIEAAQYAPKPSRSCTSATVRHPAPSPPAPSGTASANSPSRPISGSRS
jgi:hypothetical protein